MRALRADLGRLTTGRVHPHTHTHTHVYRYVYLRGQLCGLLRPIAARTESATVARSDKNLKYAATQYFYVMSVEGSGRPLLDSAPVLLLTLEKFEKHGQAVY